MSNTQQQIELLKQKIVRALKENDIYSVHPLRVQLNELQMRESK